MDWHISVFFQSFCRLLKFCTQKIYMCVYVVCICCIIMDIYMSEHKSNNFSFLHQYICYTGNYIQFYALQFWLKNLGFYANKHTWKIRPTEMSRCSSPASFAKEYCHAIKRWCWAESGINICLSMYNVKLSIESKKLYPCWSNLAKMSTESECLKKESMR